MKRPPARSSRRRPIPWLKWTLGALLLPPCLLGTVILARHVQKFQLMHYSELAFLTGAGVYLVMHLLLWKPIFMHVMGHELTHAFWAVVLGGKIKSLQVSAEGGQVTLSKTNFFIALAPYFFPLYTFIFVLIYLIAAPAFQPLFTFLIGFTLAFHFALTVHSLRSHQSDIKEVGAFFSLNFVYGMNLLVLVTVLSFVAPGVITLGEFLREMRDTTWEAGRVLQLWLFSGRPR